MYLAVMLALLISMGCVIVRGTLGPTVYDRLLAVNAFGTNIVVVIALLAFLVDDMMFLDIALVYGLINFITTIALLKFVKHNSFDDLPKGRKHG